MSLLAQTSTQQLVTSSITAVTAQFQTLSTQTFNVSSINGIVPGAAFNGSTLGLSSGTVFTSSITTNALQVNSYINAQGGALSNVGTEYFTVSKYTTTFTPLLISGCILWLDAQDPYALSIQPANGTSMTSWKDKSSSGFTFTSGGSAYNTTIMNGLPGISLAVNPFLYNPGSPQNNWQEVFVVAVYSGGGSTFYDSAGRPGLIGGYTDGGAIVTIFGDNGSATWSSQGTYSMANFWQNGVNSTTAFPGILSPSVLRTAYPSAISAQGMAIGTDRTNGGHFNGYIAEVIAYNTALTNAQRLQVEGYLAWRWGINSVFPIQYTYYNTPPPPFGTVYLPAGSIGTDVGSNITIKATTQTSINLLGNVQVASTLTASTVSTFLVKAQTISTPMLNVSTINGLAVPTQFVGSTVFLSAALVQAPFISTQNIQVSTINGQTFGGPIQSTVIGLGSAGYISSTQLYSTVQGIGSGFTGSTIGLSAATINVSTLNSVYFSSVQGYVSSLRTDSLTVGGPTGYVTVQDLTTGTVSTGQLVAGAGFISSLQINTLSFGPTGYVIVSNFIANTLSTTKLNAQSIYGNNVYVGNVSSQSAILFPGIDGNYRGTAIAEQTTGVGTQELLLYKVSSTTDQIRLQTTGNMVFEVGAPSRSWNSTTQLATPSLYIAGSTSNVGIGTNTPATTFDVVGTGRFQILSSLSLNVSSINGAAPGGTFNGSTLALSTALVTTSTLKTNVLTTSSALITLNGSAAPTSFGLGVDTMTLQANVAYTGGVASLAFAAATAGYPLGRIYMIDSASSGPAVSQMVFQTVPVSATSFSSNYSYTGANQTFTVPAGVTTISVAMWGGGGGGGQNSLSLGGAGAFLQGTLSVTPGQTLALVVGQGGIFNQTTATYGGGGATGGAYGYSSAGGGRSAIQLVLSNIISGASVSGANIVYTTSSAHGLLLNQPVVITGLSTGFNGNYAVLIIGSTTQFTVSNTTSASGSSTGTGTLYAELVDVGGGGGGGWTGTPNGWGGAGSYTGSGFTGAGAVGYGGGGTQTSGGTAGAAGTGGVGYSGSILAGGQGGNYASGGGGGYYGGGGAGNNTSGGGAGGGSSYTSYTGFTLITGSNSANGNSAPATGYSGYQAGVAAGGATTTSGGPGLILLASIGNALAEAMRIGSNGYVGIGTTAPTTTLDVAGTGRFQILSTLALNVSTINGAAPWQQSYLTSTVQGLGLIGYVSSQNILSTVQGLTQGLGTAGYISSTQLLSTVIGLGSLGYISSPQLASTVRGLTITATNAFTGSTTSLSAGTIFVSSLSMNTTLVSTMSMVDTTLVSTTGTVNQQNLILYYNNFPFAGTQAWFGQMIIPPGPPLTAIYPYTGSAQTWVVPIGVNSINAYMWAAGGGGVTTASGGAGAFIQAAVPVTPGETLTLIVGGGGGVASTSATYGGGGAGGGGGFGTQGGGRTAIQRGSLGATDYITVGAGGGGSGYGSAGAGGAGGISTGSPAAGTTGLEGQGGTQVAGGAGTSGVISAGAAGTAGAGGAAGAYGGGGGSGYYGGGGSGATSGVGGSGGGGSSFVNNVLPITLTASAGAAAPGTSIQYYTAPVAAGGTSIAGTGGNGLIVVSYTAAPPAAPSGLTLTLNGSTATLSWTSAGTPLYYWAFYGNSVSAYTGTYLMSGSTAGTSVSYSMSATYFDYFRLVSLSPLGCISQIVSSPIIQVPAPTGLTITALGTAVTMSWTAVSGATGYAYTLYSNTGYAYGGSSVATGSVGTNTATYSSGVAGTYYYFTVSATTGYGTSLSTTSGIVQGVPSFTATTFTYTGSNQSYTVPSNSGLVNVYMWGAGGYGGTQNTSASYYGGYGGAGAYLQGALTVTPSQSLIVIVGGGGGATANLSAYGGGGAPASIGSQGGGGRSAIQITSGTDVVTVGAGGASGRANPQSAVSLDGGAGSWNGTGSPGVASAGGAAYVGQGGTTSAGGACGSKVNAPDATDGGLYFGGHAGNYGGGGGSGYYGGGGGTDTGAFGNAGGGGSSLITNLISPTGSNSSNGYSAPGTGVSYYVSGVAAGGSNNTSGGNGCVVILPVSLASPTNLALTPAVGNTATLSWTASAGATGYNWALYRSSTNGYFGTSVSTGSTSSTVYTATVTGLNYSYYYYFTVIATGSPNSAAAVSPIMYELPDAPSGLTITTTGTAVNMSWSATSGALYYTYTVYQATAYAYTGSVVATANNGTSTSASYTGVATNYYYFTLSVTTANGTSALSTSGIAQAISVGVSITNYTSNTVVSSTNYYYFTTVGTTSTTITNPGGLSMSAFILAGGGGGGSWQGGGGGAGGLIITSGSYSGTYSVVVGGGGLGGVSGTTGIGANGSNSVFNANTAVGGGGGGGYGAGNPTSGGSGGGGGYGQSGAGNTVGQGNSGGTGGNSSSGGGGGAGTAGSNASGNVGGNGGFGYGGTSISTYSDGKQYGGGGGGGAGDPAGSTTPGLGYSGGGIGGSTNNSINIAGSNALSNSGSGGGGGANYSGGSGRGSGGNGGSGIVILSFLPLSPPTNPTLVSSGSSATMSWTAASAATGYSWNLYQSATNTYAGTSFATGTTATTSPTSAPTGLSSGKFWYFTVASTAGNSSSAVVASSIISY